jgi:SAM-dependent methyltransferase
VHPSAYKFATTALDPGEVTGKTVIEAGAQDVNGSARASVEAYGPAAYLATDMYPGNGVDVVCAAQDLPARFGDATADVVISTEMLEHAEDWQGAMAGMLTVLRPGGVLVLTTRSEGFPPHGYPDDWWRFSPAAMEAILKAAGLEDIQVQPDPDPASPGVFARAVRPKRWKLPDGLAGAWDAAGVTPMPRG